MNNLQNHLTELRAVAKDLRREGSGLCAGSIEAAANEFEAYFKTRPVNLDEDLEGYQDELSAVKKELQNLQDIVSAAKEKGQGFIEGFKNRIEALEKQRDFLAKENRELALKASFFDFHCEKCGHHAHPDEKCGFCQLNLMTEAKSRDNQELLKLNNDLLEWKVKYNDLKSLMESHAPEGRNITNQEYFNLRFEKERLEGILNKSNNS